MEKEFIEYHSEEGKIPYSASTICFCLTQYAKDYVKESRENILGIDKKVRDAVLVDAINYLGSVGACDFGLYTKDLYEDKRHEEIVESQILLTIMSNHLSYYIFNQDLVESVLRNNHMNECRKEFAANDGAIIILDFINYIAKRNGYAKVFTIRELQERFKFQKHNMEMAELKEFLQSYGQYYFKLISGQSINNIFRKMALMHDLGYIDIDGIYHYTAELEEKLGRSKMFPWDAAAVDREIYAMAYAHERMNEIVGKEKCNDDIISKKVLEMKKR